MGKRKKIGKMMWDSRKTAYVAEMWWTGGCSGCMASESAQVREGRR